MEDMGRVSEKRLVLCGVLNEAISGMMVVLRKYYIVSCTNSRRHYYVFIVSLK